MAYPEVSATKNHNTPDKSPLSFQELKSRIHRRLIERIDLAKLDLLRNGELANEIGYVIERLIVEEGVPLSRQEKERLVIEVQHETFGLGPIEPLLTSPDISDILVNNYASTYVERFGKLEKTDIVFRDNNHLLQIIERIVTRVGRRIDESSPYVDA
ncbi:MAG TPA: ATPase, T2SS/T4P/T4SS family, partial [Desulfuromonadaceae bacterium]